MSTTPDPMTLWRQAGGGTKDYDPQRYRELMHEHGLLLRPGDEGYGDAPRSAPCGWPRAGSDGDSSAVPVSPDGGEVQGRTEPLSASERDLIRSDLGQLLEALGLGDYARPESPHEVMLQCIAEVGRIRAAERERNAAEVDALAAEFAKPDASVSLFENLIRRAAFPAIHEALKGAAGLIRGGLPDLEQPDD